MDNNQLQSADIIRVYKIAFSSSTFCDVTKMTSFDYEHEPEACLREARHSAENFKSAEMSEYQGCINLTIISSMSSASESETFGVTKTSHGRRSWSLLCKLGSNSTVGHFFLWDESDSMLKNPFYNSHVLSSIL